MPVTKRIKALQDIQDNSDGKRRKLESKNHLKPCMTSNKPQTSKTANNEEVEQCLEIKCTEQIRILVSRQDHTKMVAFIMKKDDKMKRIFNRYASLVGVEASALRFLYDGYRVNEMDTPNDLHIENDNVLEVYKLEHEGEKCYFKLLSPL